MTSVHPEWPGKATLKRKGYADLALGDLAKLAPSLEDGGEKPVPEYVMQRGHRLAGVLRVPKGFLRDVSSFSIGATEVKDGGRWRNVGAIGFSNGTGPETKFDPDATEIPFVFDDMPAGEIRIGVFFHSKSFAPLPSVNRQLSLDADTNDVELTVATLGTLEVSLVDAAGERVDVGGALARKRWDGQSWNMMGLGTMPEDRLLAIVDGMASDPVFGDPDEPHVTVYDDYLVGYRFATERRSSGRKTFELPGDGSTLRVTIPVEPAGALRVRLLEEDGEMAREGEGEVNFYLNPSGYGGWDGRYSSLHDGMMFSPLRFDEYEVIVTRGSSFVSTGKVTLNLENPVADRVLRFEKGVRLAGRLLDAAGEPVVGAKIRLSYIHYKNDTNTGTLEAGKAVTATDGSFGFEHVHLGLPMPWCLETIPEPDGPRGMPWHRFEIDSTTPLPLTLRLPETHAVSGRLLHYETGDPVPGVEVRAMLRPEVSEKGRPQGVPDHHQPALEATDEAGIFRFHNLEAGLYDFRFPNGDVLSEREKAGAPAAATDPRRWIDLLQVPEPSEGANVFWYRPSR